MQQVPHYACGFSPFIFSIFTFASDANSSESRKTLNNKTISYPIPSQSVSHPYIHHFIMQPMKQPAVNQNQPEMILLQCGIFMGK